MKRMAWSAEERLIVFHCCIGIDDDRDDNTNNNRKI